MAREVYTEEFRQKQRKKSLEIYANNPQISQMLSEMMVKKWQDEKYRAEMDLIMHSESFRQKDSESLKRFYQTHPEALSALSERGKRQWSEEYREKMAPLYQSEEYRALCAKNAIIRNQNPQYREKIRQKVWSNPEFIEASRKASVERWKNQQYREKMTVCMQKTWDNLDELKKRAKIIRDEHPYVNVLFAKIGAQEELSENELIYLKEYYSEFWSEKDTRELYSQMAKKIFSEYGTLKL